jgi:hypothetical protein
VVQAEPILQLNDEPDRLAPDVRLVFVSLAAAPFDVR